MNFQVLLKLRAHNQQQSALNEKKEVPKPV